MSTRSRTNTTVALLSAIALTMSAVAPAYAKKASFCRDYAESVATNESNLILLPILAIGIGTGVGAAVGAVVGGLGITAAAVGGGATGGIVGVVGTSSRYNRTYQEAYAECRASH